MDVFIGTIMSFAFNFAPYGWLPCMGQTLAINQYQALYALLGTRYGGDGVTNFKLPDLRGRVPMGWTVNTTPPPTPTPITVNQIGQFIGVESFMLAQAQIPAHTHAASVTGTGGLSGSITAALNVNQTTGSELTPNGNYLGIENNGGGLYATSSEAGKTLNSGSITVNNGLSLNLSGLAVTVNRTQAQSVKTSVIQPSLVINYCIAITGLFPTQD